MRDESGNSFRIDQDLVQSCRGVLPRERAGRRFTLARLRVIDEPA
jgi:hypothetical protein